MKKILILVLLSTVMLASCDSQKKLATEKMNQVMKNKEAINAFYGKALTVNKETSPTAVMTPLLADGYQSSSSSSSKGAKELMGQVEFFWKSVPDLKWEPQQIMNDGDSYIVRSIASGTPNGNFMGVPTDGSKSFKIMTIDVHTMKDGKFISTNHVEDWSTAMQQLKPKKDESAAKEAKETMDVAMGFMNAMTSGKMEEMKSFMHKDMVWQNGGDESLPWIGVWKGKKVILEKFLPTFSTNFQTLKWESDDALSDGDTAAFFGQMAGKLTKSNQKTKEFTWALRVKVKDGKVILWNWFEDSFEVSNAYHGK